MTAESGILSSASRSADGSPSEDLSGVEFVNGTRPGNPELMELAKQQAYNDEMQRRHDRAMAAIDKYFR